jgi:hypothetical protein
MIIFFLGTKNEITLGKKCDQDYEKNSYKRPHNQSESDQILIASDLHHEELLKLLTGADPLYQSLDPIGNRF